MPEEESSSWHCEKAAFLAKCQVHNQCNPNVEENWKRPRVSSDNDQGDQKISHQGRVVKPRLDRFEVPIWSDYVILNQSVRSVKGKEGRVAGQVSFRERISKSGIGKFVDVDCVVSHRK